jgi:hypothetical protein
MLRLPINWRDGISGIAVDIPETAEPTPETTELPDHHDQVGSQEIVEPPDSGEDQEMAHGGDDVCAEIEDAPERADADGDIGDTQEDSDAPSGEHNNRQAFALATARKRRLANTFATVLAKIADDLSGWPIPGDDEWDIQALMERRISRRPLAHCRQSREWQCAVLVLDTSGSCREQADFFAGIAEAARAAGDVEIYSAPNADLEGSYGQSWPFTGRTIIFFGDFDGGNNVVEAAKKNKVYWFSCENRYADMDGHDWCSHTLADFRGKYYRCEAETDFLHLAKKIR